MKALAGVLVRLQSILAYAIIRTSAPLCQTLEYVTSDNSMTSTRLYLSCRAVRILYTLPVKARVVGQDLQALAEHLPARNLRVAEPNFGGDREEARS